MVGSLCRAAGTIVPMRASRVVRVPTGGALQAGRHPLPVASTATRRTSRLVPLQAASKHAVVVVESPTKVRARNVDGRRWWCAAVQLLPPSGGARPAIAIWSFGQLHVSNPILATKIQRFLGDNCTVLASYGHVRDLPPRAGSVEPEHGFDIKWQLTPKAGPRLAQIEAALGTRSPRSTGTVLVLATDPDREGEAIAWHLADELQRRGAVGPSTEVQRITFTEITKDAVLAAMAQPREITAPLVDAYLARRALDYLVGFHLSPVLWRRLPGARSAGRVQSVALRLVSEREAVVEAFEPVEYWSIDVELVVDEESPALVATLTHVDGVKLPDMAIRNEAEAQALVERIAAASFKVMDVSRKTVSRSPSPPFTTSTMQQEASRWLGFGATRTMSAAQKLYEGAGTGEGLITYMRTDGLQLAAEAVGALRSTARSDYGDEFVPESPRFYKSRAKNAQEAHEAVRPTRPSLHPWQLPARVEPDCARLYELIWRRSLACQMANAAVEQVGANFESEDASLRLRATGSVVRFPGFLKAYDMAGRRQRRAEAGGSSSIGANTDDDEEEAEEQEGGDVDRRRGDAGGVDSTAALSALASGQPVSVDRVLPLQHHTRPPPRFTEATLIKALEELGIGRPSTYATILSVLQARGYIVKEGRSLHCNALGRVLSAFLVHYFAKYVDYGFTRDLEDQLDEISGGRREWLALMDDFWSPFSSSVQDMSKTTITDVYNMLDEVLGPQFFRAPSLPSSVTAAGGVSPQAASQGQSTPLADPRVCPECGIGRLVLKPSRAGGFIGCSRYDECGCKYARPMAVEQLVVDEDSGEVVRMPSNGHVLGNHPDNNLPIVVKVGPFGQYLELLGSEELPEQQAQVPDARRDDDDNADGKEAATTRKGRKRKPKAPPKPKPKRASLPAGKGSANITLEQAVALLSLPRLLGQHPDDGAPVIANTGRFGPYVAHNGANAALGKRFSAHGVSLDDAVELLEAKAKRTAAREARAAAGELTAADRRAMAVAARSSAGRRKRSAAVKRAKPAASTAGSRRAQSAASASSGTRVRSPRARAYSLFQKESFADVRASAPDSTLGEAMAEVARRWREMSDDDKVAWEQRVHEDDSARPAGGMAVRGKRAKSPPASAATREQKKVKSAQKAAGTDGSERRTRSPRARAYSLFQKESFADVRASAPDSTLGEAMAEVARRWREMSNEEKAAWHNCASALRNG